jgi:8-oxo-dGTP pyrophosphatase MutT (NUDIX family)
MPLTTTYIDHKGNTFIFEYFDADSFDDLDKSKCTQTYGVCFCDGKIVLGYSGGRKEYGLIGGTIEEGEPFEQTLRREVKEESNMNVISFSPVGYQKVTSTKDQSVIYQLRYACEVEPFGPFVLDTMGDIVELKLIDPSEHKEYLKWGEIGERIIERAIDIMNKKLLQL